MTHIVLVIQNESLYSEKSFFGIILTPKVGCYDQVKSYQVLTTGRLILGDHGAK